MRLRRLNQVVYCLSVLVFFGTTSASVAAINDLLKTVGNPVNYIWLQPPLRAPRTLRILPIVVNVVFIFLLMKTQRRAPGYNIEVSKQCFSVLSQEPER